MKSSKILAVAWENLTQRKLRASLTTLGVVIGIAAIIGLAALGEGFRLEIRERIQQGFELNVLIVIPGSFTAALRPPFIPQEVNSVRNVTGVALVAPLITLPQVKIYNETNQRINAFTVGAVNFSEMTQMVGERFIPIEGEIPGEDENDTIVLGYRACFLNETTRLARVGDNVTVLQINVSKTLRVAAILGKGGTPGITNFDNWAFIPTKTAVQLMEGEEAYNLILVKVSDIEQSEQVANDIENVFENPYAISVLVPIAFVRQVDRILAIVQLFLMAIASISLLVAGIGIMNIMTVSVMERTREIGILKAIGAKSRTVLAMFLSEAVLVGMVGGLIGILTGYGLSFVLSYGLSNFIQPQQQDTAFQSPGVQQSMAIRPVFSLEWTIIAFIFAVIVCIIFGLYPARKASKLNPVDALRYE
ncbi:ABC transporter permease [Candidatus Bathyarchaeota archaeon]|nr:ABC transporter permease [Candidatus Bathyarchaeota archaeon]